MRKKLERGFQSRNYKPVLPSLDVMDFASVSILKPQKTGCADCASLRMPLMNGLPGGEVIADRVERVK
jgi:hypothetical protein